MSVDLEMEEILNLFFEESIEGLNIMESGLLALEQGTDLDIINTIFRAAHSIKGGAGTFGFLPISAFTHSVETLLDDMRSGARPLTSEGLQILLQSVDVIRDMVQAARTKQPIDMAEADAVSVELLRILARQVRPVAAAQGMQEVVAESAGTAPLQGWRIGFEPDANLFRNCNDPLRIFDELATLGPLEVTADTSDLPALAAMDPVQCFMRWTLVLHAPIEQARLAEVFDWVDATAKLTYDPIRGHPSATAAPPFETLQPVTAPLPPDTAAPVGAMRAGAEAGSLRVATEKVDALINLVGELVITQSMLGRFADKYQPEDMEALRRSLAQLSRNTRELQDSVMQIRMLPIGFCFNRFPRMVHDLSRKLGKQVELKLVGETTELDKTVLEKIGDPLVHLVRNALDHGFEAPAARTAAGKNVTGTLEIKAYHEGGSIVIEVKDDGQGLDRKRILAKAVERGWVEPGAALSDAQIDNLIFVAGLTTAETLSDVSGRGVGMDVVRRNIHALGGDVQVSSTPGCGSTIRIRLPLTLAILEGQLLRVGKEIYVASLVSIVETVQAKAGSLSCVAGGAELFRHRDDYLPVVRLHELFGIEPDSRDVVDGLLVVLEADGQRIAMFVDELLAQQQVVIKSLETHFKQVPGLAGATIHGEGTVALILDVPGLIRNLQPRSMERAA